MQDLRNGLLAAVIIAGLGVTTGAYAFQGTSQDQDACRGDVMSLCMGAIGNFANPNVPAITACLKHNMSKLSPACKAVMSSPVKKH